jgi:ADP-ribose pyrophosphatase YjhB (NUDIX family)
MTGALIEDMADERKLNPRSYPDRPYVGVGVVIFRDDQVLLAQRGKWPNKFTWSIPGGAQELGETVHQTAVREIREETGLEVEIIGLVDVVDSISHDEEGRVLFHYTLVDMAAEWRAGDAIAGDDVPAVKWVGISEIESYDLRDSTIRVIRMAEEKRNAR